MQNDRPNWWKTLKCDEKISVALLIAGALWLLPRLHLGFPMLTNKGWIGEHVYRVNQAKIDGFPPQSGRLTCYWMSGDSMPYWEGDFVADGDQDKRIDVFAPNTQAVAQLCDNMNDDLLKGFIPHTLAPNVTIESNWRRFF